jgi:dTDP-4-amino-4,6-dideoxygalactose transaminase
MTAAGVMVNLHYIPVYRQPYFAQMGFKQGYCPNAEDYFKSSISIPIFSSLTSDRQLRVMALIKKHCGQKTNRRVAGAIF